jgi:hypothetical protein
MKEKIIINYRIIDFENHMFFQTLNVYIYIYIILQKRDITINLHSNQYLNVYYVFRKYIFSMHLYELFGANPWTELEYSYYIYMHVISK